MNRQQLQRALARAVAGGRLLAEEAAAFQAAFDEGSLPAGALPEAVRLGVTRELADLAFAVLLLLAGRGGRDAGSPGTGTGPDGLADAAGARRLKGRRRRLLLARFRAMALRDREALSVSLAAGFDEASWALGARLTATDTAGAIRPGFRRVGPALDVAGWHRAMAERLRDEFVLDAELALGRPLRASDLERLAPRLAEQERLLRQFAAEVSARERAGRPYTRRYVTERSRMYEGEARAYYYELAEAPYEDRDGWVFDVEGADDGHTCGPCAAGMDGAPYLAGQGFIPGRDCRGRGKCRHRRIPVYDPGAYALLAGRDVSADTFTDTTA